MPEPINVRRAGSTDAAAIAELYAQPRAMWGTMQTPYPDIEGWRKRLLEAGEQSIPLVAEFDGRVVGQLSIQLATLRQARRRHVANFGMAVHDAFARRGVGDALVRAMLDMTDNWLNITRVEMEVYTDNAPAIALYQKYGFVIEGTRRMFAFRDGHYADAHVMGRIKDLPVLQG